MARRGRELRRFEDELAMFEVSRRFTQTDEATELGGERSDAALEDTRRSLLFAARLAWDAGYGRDVRSRLESTADRLQDVAAVGSPWLGLVAELRSEVATWPPVEAPQTRASGTAVWLKLAGVVAAVVVVAVVILAQRSESSESVDERERGVEAASLTSDGQGTTSDQPFVDTQHDETASGSIGTVRLIFSLVEGGTADQIAAVATVLADAVPEFEEVEVTPDGRIRATAEGITSSESDTLADSLRGALSGTLALRPVIAEDSCEQVEAAQAEVFLAPARDGSALCVGAAQGDATIFVSGSARAREDASSGWSVVVDIRDQGQATLNVLASQCFSRSPSCPTGRLALVLDNEIIIAPQVNMPEFGDELAITGDFAEDEVRALALSLNVAAVGVLLDLDEVAFWSE